MEQAQAKQLEEKLSRYLEQRAAASCVPFENSTDVQTIRVPGIDPFKVSCDSSLIGSGWTVIQRRQDGSESFNREWSDYRAGFGNLRSEFFVGLEKLYLMTKTQPHELYIHLEDFQHNTRYARYTNFAIGSEEEAYKLESIGNYTGNAGDSMAYHLDYKFSTPDRDNDVNPTNCAKHFQSGWWFHKCYNCQSCDSFCFKTLKPLLGYASDTKLKLEECADLQSKLNDQQAITKNKIDLINVYKDLCENQTAELAALKQQLADIKNALISPLSGSCIRKQTDVYDIKVPGMEAFKVSCDSSLYNNGWTVIQRRQDGSENFNRNWTEYREGFGDIRSEFFIGLEKLYLLLKSQPHVLYIHLEDFRQEKRFALYTNFFIGNEDEAYALKSLGVYSGNAKDAMRNHLNIKFSTPDRDNDMKNGTCAESFESGWWFNKCYN
ncbi:CG31832, partial [Drosophila busckii]